MDNFVRNTKLASIPRNKLKDIEKFSTENLLARQKQTGSSSTKNRRLEKSDANRNFSPIEEMKNPNEKPTTDSQINLNNIEKSKLNKKLNFEK